MADAKADITINLEYEESRADGPIYRPGDEIVGTVVIDVPEELKCDHLYVRLVWHTAGRGTRFQRVVTEKDVHQGALRTFVPATYQFRFRAPSDPWSYEGHYVSVVWKVAVQIDVPWAKDVHAEQMIWIEPVRAAQSG
jgi:hypothetical protein